MDPQNTPTPETKDVDLHAEGVDIVGSGVSEDNEFSNTPTDKEASTEDIQALNQEKAKLIASLQEIPIPNKFVVGQKFIEMQQQQKEQAHVAPLIEKAPIPAPNPTSIPEEKREPAPQPVTPVPTPTPKEEITEQKPVNNPAIRQIRTFKSDAEEAVKYKNVSTVDIAIAEQKKRERTAIQYQEPETHHYAGLFIMVVVMIMIVLSAGWYYWFSSSQPVSEKRPISSSIKTIVPYTKITTLKLDTESDPLTLIGSKLSSVNAGLGNISALIVTESATGTATVDPSVLFRKTEIPNKIIRSLDKEYMVGVYTYDTQHPFIILKNTFFQNTFSGMLEWEKNMVNDLLPLIQVAHSETSLGDIALQPFEDILISNIDVRSLKKADGTEVLLYAFADQKTLIITTGREPLRYILDKLLTVRTIQ